MNKEAYYFSHDSNARNDIKITALRKKYGSAGYGNYWIVVELLRDQEGYRLPVKALTYGALAQEFNEDESYVETFLKDCVDDFELFETDGEFFWSNSLVRRMEMREEKRTRKVEAGKRGAKKRWSGREENSTAMAEEWQSHSGAIAKHGKGKEKKGKEKKGNQTKEKGGVGESDQQKNELESKKPVIPPWLHEPTGQPPHPEPDQLFEEFWKIYDKDVGRQATIRRWNMMSEEDRLAARARAPDYVAANPEKRFRPNPIRYLREQMWEDEIIESRKSGKPESKVDLTSESDLYNGPVIQN